MKSTQNIGYTINRTAQTVTISKSFEKKANIVGNPEYEALLTLMRDFANYTFEYKSAEKIVKQTYGKLTYDNMRKYITLTHKENAVGLLAKLEHTIKVCRTQSGTYARVKKWFLDSFPSYKADIESLNLAGEKKNGEENNAENGETVQLANAG